MKTFFALSLYLTGFQKSLTVSSDCSAIVNPDGGSGMVNCGGTWKTSDMSDKFSDDGDINNGDGVSE